MSARQFLESIWLIRVPLLSLALLAIFGIAASGSGQAMLGGLFDLEGDPLGMFLVDAMAFLVAAACVNAINMVLHLGACRFGIPALRQPSPQLQLFVFFAAMVFPSILIYHVCRLSPGFPLYAQIWLAIGAFAGAMLLVFAAKVAQMYLTDKDVTVPPPPFLVFPAVYIPPLNAYLWRVYGKKPRGGWRALKNLLTVGARWFFGILAASGDGYLIPSAPGLVLESAQVFTTALTVLSFAVYLFLGAMGHGHGVPGPALAYVLLFQMVATWVLGGLCFFFDRFRIPVLLTVFVLAKLTSTAPESDHLFRVSASGSGYVFPKPADALARHSNRPVLVATAGGGIQAAAWTTTVMAGLERQCHCDLQSHLAVFSGVSGGSVGAMNIGSVWPDLEAARRLSRRPSLDSIAWAWVNPDVAAAVLPAFHDKFLDRGRALEESWESVPGVNLGGDVLLANWARKIYDPRPMPAFLFNSTNVESGAPVVFATTQFPVSNSEIVDYTRKARSFHDLYRDFKLEAPVDVPVATAVRMSATFPYVSPAARPYLDTLKRASYHFVDGGYYDNYGVYTLLDWLEDALNTTPAKPPGLAVIRIVAFPKDAGAEGTTKGWGFQTTAPLNAFLSTRSTGQLVESDMVLSRFAEHWKAKGVDVETFVFRYPQFAEGECKDPALSWKLTAVQQGCLDKAWQDPNVETEAARLAAYLGGR